jgi:hypothetical protein
MSERCSGDPIGRVGPSHRPRLPRAGFFRITTPAYLAAGREPARADAASSLTDHDPIKQAVHNRARPNWQRLGPIGEPRCEARHDRVESFDCGPPVGLPCRRGAAYGVYPSVWPVCPSSTRPHARTGTRPDASTSYSVGGDAGPRARFLRRALHGAGAQGAAAAALSGLAAQRHRAGSVSPPIPTSRFTLISGPGLSTTDAQAAGSGCLAWTIHGDSRRHARALTNGPCGDRAPGRAHTRPRYSVSCSSPSIPSGRAAAPVHERSQPAALPADQPGDITASWNAPSGTGTGSRPARRDGGLRPDERSRRALRHRMSD